MVMKLILRNLVQNDFMDKISKDITTQQLMNMCYKYNFSKDELIADWNRLREVQLYKTGSQFKPGMKLCQHFCDNFWNIENEKGMSFAKAWADFETMDKVRQWGLEGMSNLWLSWIRRAVFMCAGLPNSSFYRPHFAKQIIGMSGKSAGTLFDPCIGWGGRMLGTVAAGWNYIGCDPNQETFANVERILSFIRDNTNALYFPEVSLYNIPVEDFKIETEIDIVLTSPPYFNLEIYNHDDNQSYNKHDSYDTWKEDWLLPLIEKSLGMLKDDGISAWNVMNFKNNDIVGNMISAHEKNGWKLKSTIGFDSPLANIRKLKNKDVTYIFMKNPNESGTKR